MYLTEHLGPKIFTNLVRFSHEFVIYVIVITEFDCNIKWPGIKTIVGTFANVVIYQVHRRDHFQSKL